MPPHVNGLAAKGSVEAATNGDRSANLKVRRQHHAGLARAAGKWRLRIDRHGHLRDHAPIGTPERENSAPDANRDVLELIEEMLDLDEQLAFWRFHHVRMAERVIGKKTGTGGSEGVDYLERSMMSKGKAFPDLWEVRTLL